MSNWYLEVQDVSGSRHRIAKKILVMILSSPFLVPFLVPAFLLSQVPLGCWSTGPCKVSDCISSPIKAKTCFRTRSEKPFFFLLLAGWRIRHSY